MKENELDVQLETLMDTATVFTVLCSLSRICNEKASYVSEGGSHGGPSLYMTNRWNKETSSKTATSAMALRRTRDRGPWFDGYTET